MKIIKTFCFSAWLQMQKFTFVIKPRSHDCIGCHIIHFLQEEVRNLAVPAGRRKKLLCAFFNFTGGVKTTGGWSFRGVNTMVINDTHVQCNASHLTSFAVLVSIVPAVEDSVSQHACQSLRDIIVFL